MTTNIGKIPHKTTFAERHENFYNMLVEIKTDRLSGVRKTMAYYFIKFHVGKMKSSFFDGIENKNITPDFALTLLKEIMDYNNSKPLNKEIQDAIAFLAANGYTVTKN